MWHSTWLYAVTQSFAIAAGYATAAIIAAAPDCSSVVMVVVVVVMVVVSSWLSLLVPC
jgi:hypothetical protein